MKITPFLLLGILLSFQSRAQDNIPKRGYAVDWIVPQAMANPQILQYERMELGVNLHDSVQKQIQAFLRKEMNGRELNPFNPEDMDIKASFYFEENGEWTLKNDIYAFFYEEFKRNTESPDPNEWKWSKLKTHDNFRIRYTPTLPGKWRFKVNIKIKGRDVLTLGEYQFSCQASDKPGFVKVSPGGRYLELGGKSFLPIGQNLPKPTCYYQKDSLGNIIYDEYNCSKCECAGYEEWCPHLKHLPINPNAYMTYLKELEKLRNAGANYYRVFIFPHTYEIEYDKLGDYSSRMNVAWELDRVFETSEQLGLKVHFNLFLGYPVSKAHYGVKAWDWYADDQYDKGYAYMHELGLKEPIEFLTNPEAKKQYKNRLRYIISRWGYSTAIAIIEMMSEINNKFGEYPQEIYQWHAEMTRYIKEELGHTNHLIAVNYDGAKPNEERGDLSFSLPGVDVITHNIHRVNTRRKELQDAYKTFAYHNKPFFFSEIGTGDTEIEVCDNNAEWIKDVWMTMFSGTCSSGINWNEQHNYRLWENFRHVEAYTRGLNFDEYSLQENSTRRDKLAEHLALISADKSKSIGVIQNLTWNYYTHSAEKNCKEDFLPAQPYRRFKVLINAGRRRGFQFDGQKNGIYVVEWYSPFSPLMIGNEVISAGRKARFELKHPLLTEELPFVLYKVYLKP